VILGHVMGLPVEESILQVVPAVAGIATTIAIAGRVALDRLFPRRR